MSLMQVDSIRSGARYLALAYLPCVVADIATANCWLSKNGYRGVSEWLFLNDNRRAIRGPAVGPLGLGRGHVYASVAARRTKVIVPKSSMQAIGLIKVHNPGHVFKIVVFALHVAFVKLYIDAEGSLNCWEACAAG